MESRRTEIKRHLPEQEIDEMLREAKDVHHFRRIDFVSSGESLNCVELTRQN